MHITDNVRKYVDSSSKQPKQPHQPPLLPSYLPTYLQMTFSTIQTLNRAVSQLLRSFREQISCFERTEVSDSESSVDSPPKEQLNQPHTAFSQCIGKISGNMSFQSHNMSFQSHNLIQGKTATKWSVQKIIL